MVIVLASAFISEKFDVVISICNRFLSKDFFLEKKDGFVIEYVPGHLTLGHLIDSFSFEPRSMRKFLMVLSALRSNQYLNGIEEIVQEIIEVPEF
jgi:hypothetical protein